MKIYKCNYKHCSYGGNVSDIESVKYNNRRYHEKCLNDKNLLSEIRKFYLEKINNSEVMVILNKAINEIVFKKNISPDFLLFTLKYIHNNKMKLNSIFGVYYYINNYKIKNEYEKYRNKCKNKIDFKNKNLQDEYENFTLKNQPNKIMKDINKLM